jgi:serralysin
MFSFSFRRPRQVALRSAPRLRTRPSLEALEDRLAPATATQPTLTIVGVDQGPPHVKVFASDNQLIASFFAFDPAFQGGVRVAIGDVNGDGVLDYIAGAGAGAQTHVKVIDGTRASQVLSNGQIADSALLASFIAFDPTVTSGVFVTAGDFNHDGRAEVAVSAATNPESHVRVFTIAAGLGIATRSSGPLGDFVPYAGFAGGITLAAGDLNGDGRAELVTGTFRGSSHLKAFDSATGATVLSEFAYPGFTGGFSVSTADLNGDGKAEIITGGAIGAGGHIKILDGVTGQETSSYFGMEPNYNGGTRVATVTVAPTGSTNSGDIRVVGACSAGGLATINESTPDGVITGSIQPFGSFAGGLFVASSIDFTRKASGTI